MDVSPDPMQNHLLAALPQIEFAKLRPHLEPVHLGLGQMLYEPGGRLTHLYFPIDCVFARVYMLHDGETGEIALVGNEGVVGIALFMGDEDSATASLRMRST